jgi:ribose transport system permease protein
LFVDRLEGDEAMSLSANIKKVIQFELTGVLGVVILICLILGFVTHGFFSHYNLESISLTIAIAIIVGLSQLSVLSIGNFNLALGPMGALGGVCTGVLMQIYGVPVLIAILAGLVLGTLAGAFQGYLIIKTGINPFIITLALASIYLGGITALTQAEFYNYMPKVFDNIASATYLGIPLLLIIAVVFAYILWTVFSHLPIGRQLLSIGASQKASYFSGIPTNNVIIIAHAMSGFCAALAGILLVARLNSASIDIPPDWMLASFAAPVLGGTLISGGKVSITGTIIGAILMTVINNGLLLLGVSTYWYQSFLGAILLGAFALDRVRLAYIVRQRT